MDRVDGFFNEIEARMSHEQYRGGGGGDRGGYGGNNSRGHYAPQGSWQGGPPPHQQHQQHQARPGLVQLHPQQQAALEMMPPPGPQPPGTRVHHTPWGTTVYLPEHRDNVPGPGGNGHGGVSGGGGSSVGGHDRARDRGDSDRAGAPPPGPSMRDDAIIAWRRELGLILSESVLDERAPKHPLRPLPSHRLGPRRSRWQRESDRCDSLPGGIPLVLSTDLSQEALDAVAARVRLDEVSAQLANNVWERNSRSPSPEPIYDQRGVRINKLENRKRDAALRDRHLLVETAAALDSYFRPPGDYKPLRTRRQKKIAIPVKRFPDTNFIGLLIGPRGKTLRGMEDETGAKIAIRGKGSTKEGKAGRRDGRVAPGDSEPLHVLITGDDDAAIKRAIRAVAKHLVPIPEGENEHKRSQLRLLAELNGTLKVDEMACKTCGDNAHREWECPLAGPGGRFESASAAASTCLMCHQPGHLTADCPNTGRDAAQRRDIDSEVSSFLGEIGLPGSEAKRSGDWNPPLPGYPPPRG